MIFPQNCTNHPTIKNKMHTFVHTMTPQKMLTVFGMKIKTARIEAGISASALARKLNLHRDTLRTIESGKGGSNILVYLQIQQELKIKNLLSYEPEQQNS